MTETSKENEMSEQQAGAEALAMVIRDEVKRYPINNDWRTMAGHFGATEFTIAEAVIAAGWVSPEEHADVVAFNRRSEADKGRLWQHLRDRCASAEVEVRGWRAMRDRLEAALDGVWHDADDLYDAIQAALIAPEVQP